MQANLSPGLVFPSKGAKEQRRKAPIAGLLTSFTIPIFKSYLQFGF
jgi:hypothetical protein